LKRTIFSILFASALVLSFSLVTAVPAAAGDLLPVTVNTPGRPTLMGTITTDGTSIIFNIRAVGQADDGDDINPSKYNNQTNWDNEYFTATANNKLVKYNMFNGNTTPYWGTGTWSASDPLPEGVTFSQTQDGDDFVYVVSMSYAALEISGGDTFPVRIKARDFNDNYVQSYSGYVGYDGEYSQYRGLWITDTGTINVTVPKPVTHMASFDIDHAKIDFKKKPDDKVRVQGKLELDLVNSDGVNISEDITVTVGLLSESITMEQRGKKDEKWEYKRPKDGGGNIKKMTINWKNGKFDIRIDKADLSEVTNLVIISILIGDDIGSASILMKEKKHHWDYKAPHEKSD